MYHQHWQKKREEDFVYNFINLCHLFWGSKNGVFFIKCVDTTIKKESKTYLLQFKSFIEYLSFSTISRVSEEFLEVIVVGLVSHEESHYPVQFAQ